ncbi:hypothetical protein H6G04_29040 [Calothrix membranacea FACHB-236]|nr:hypothetical protein [Calothrix membranacea FACHB-236]
MGWLEHLQEQQQKDLELLKKLEDKLRYENNPRRQGELHLEIDEIKERIKNRASDIQQESILNKGIYTVTPKLNHQSLIGLNKEQLMGHRNSSLNKSVFLQTWKILLYFAVIFFILALALFAKQEIIGINGDNNDHNNIKINVTNRN